MSAIVNQPTSADRRRKDGHNQLEEDERAVRGKNADLKLKLDELLSEVEVLKQLVKVCAHEDEATNSEKIEAGENNKMEL